MHCHAGGLTLSLFTKAIHVQHDNSLNRSICCHKHLQWWFFYGVVAFYGRHLIFHQTKSKDVCGWSSGFGVSHLTITNLFRLLCTCKSHFSAPVTMQHLNERLTFSFKRFIKMAEHCFQFSSKSS